MRLVRYFAESLVRGRCCSSFQTKTPYPALEWRCRVAKESFPIIPEELSGTFHRIGAGGAWKVVVIGRGMQLGRASPIKLISRGGIRISYASLSVMQWAPNVLSLTARRDKMD